MIKIKRGDLFILLAVLLAAGVLFAWQRLSRPSGGLVAEIYLEGELSERIPLAGESRQLRLETSLGWNTLELEPGMVTIVSADCPGQECVLAGSISHPGQVVACLPHRLVIRLAGENSPEEGYDAVAG